MTKKNIFLIVLVLLLGALSLYLNKSRFQSEPVRIGERWSQPRGWMLRRSKNPPTGAVLIFLLDRPLKLTTVKVIPISDLETNKYPHPIWHLTTDSNSIPVKDLVYGMNIRGMKPAVKGAVADPLQPGVPYRLFVEAGDLKAERDFTPPPKTP